MNKFQRSMAADVVIKENTKYGTRDQSIDRSIHRSAHCAQTSDLITYSLFSINKH